MNNQEFINLCISKLQEKNLTGNNYLNRLNLEIKEIENQKCIDYFVKLYKNKIKYSNNENNLLVPYLLDIVSEFDLEKDPKYIQGDLPDVDIDFIKDGVKGSRIRDYLKNEWIPSKYGKEFVCNIGTNNTYGIRGALIDMARIHNLDRQEILSITTKLPDKDADGKPLVWEAALELSPALKEYCRKYPEVADAAEKLISRNRSRGKHAAGIIISKIPLDDFLPLETDKNDNIISAWSEGQHEQDLQPVGLSKIDLLVTLPMMVISYCCKLIKDRHNISNICANDSGINFSNPEAYLNDPQALKMASEGDLKGIFQFDSDGIRKICREAGITRFEDIPAISALYRPGPLKEKMDKTFIRRKRGEEEYVIHPVLRPILEKTYGVMIFQEQIMAILSTVGNIPAKDTYDVIKAISKKKIGKFSKYKEKFIINGQSVLGWNQEQMEEFWQQIESFAGYGFNASHAVCYAYPASRLLWLKSHYLLEFYCSLLYCESDTAKIKEYRADARKHNINVLPIDINKSKVSFSIQDDSIYYGFSSIKGLGEDVSKRIVENQPYSSFEDFLKRFGTEASVIKPIIALRLFNDADPIILFKYYDYYKEKINKINNSNKRNVTSLEKYFYDFVAAVDQVIPEDLTKDEILEKYKDVNSLTKKIYKKYIKSKENHNNKDSNIISLKDFNPDDYKINPQLETMLLDLSACQKLCYGYEFITTLERSPDYDGNKNFSDFKHLVEHEHAVCAPVEVRINKIICRKWKNGKGSSYIIEGEDSLGEIGSIVMWEDDFKRWEPELNVGNLVKLRIKPPDRYMSYTFESPEKRYRYKLPDKKSDSRLILMRFPNGSDN